MVVLSELKFIVLYIHLTWDLFSISFFGPAVFVYIHIRSFFFVFMPRKVSLDVRSLSFDSVGKCDR